MNIKLFFQVPPFRASIQRFQLQKTDCITVPLVLEPLNLHFEINDAEEQTVIDFLKDFYSISRWNFIGMCTQAPLADTAVEILDLQIVSFDTVLSQLQSSNILFIGNFFTAHACPIFRKFEAPTGDFHVIALDFDAYSKQYYLLLSDVHISESQDVFLANTTTVQINGIPFCVRAVIPMEARNKHSCYMEHNNMYINNRWPHKLSEVGAGKQGYGFIFIEPLSREACTLDHVDSLEFNFHTDPPYVLGCTSEEDKFVSDEETALDPNGENL